MRKKFLVVFLSFIISFVIIFSPLTALATDYGNYCADDIAYPAVDLPAFNNLQSGKKVLLYNSLDGLFYLVICTGGLFLYSEPGVPSLVSGTTLYYYVYSCDVTASAPTWILVKNGYRQVTDYNDVFYISTAKKYKFLYTSEDINFYANGYQSGLFIVSNTTDSAGYIYANFYEPTGLYLGDSNNPNDSGGGGGEGEGGSYNDSSFKSLVTDLFDHLFDVLLYGNDEDYDGTDVDDSIQWLEDLSDDMEDITDKLNEAPDYIEDGFTALSGSQTAVNDFFTGISSAVPILYYGIVGILTIIIIRKIIGR